MLDLNDFVYFPDGEIEIGINFIDADSISSLLKNTGIRKEYISASTPPKKIYYNSFLIQKKLITVEKFKEFVLETEYITDAEKDGWGWIWDNKWIKKHKVSWERPFLNESDIVYNNHQNVIPVMQISWNDALEYTKWLSKLTGDNIRLPFEYEWEILGNYANVSSIVNNDNEDKQINFSTNDFIAILYENISNSKFQLGLLWEWTMDWYKGYNQNTVNKDFGNIYKVLRGGSLLSESIQKTKEFRFRRCPTARSPYYGFRIVSDIQK